MRKLLIALPLFAGASWAGTTYYSGSQTQPGYERLLEQLNSSRLFVFESKDYDAGFMQSTALTEVRFSSAESPEVFLTLEHTISHSPVSMVPDSARFGAAKIVTRIAKDKIEDEETRRKLENFNTGEPFVLTTDVSMDGTTDSQLKINSFDYTDSLNPSKSASFTEGVINLLTTPSGDISGDGVLPDITFSDDESFQGQSTNNTLNFELNRLSKESGLHDIEFLYDYTLNIDLGESKILNVQTNQVEALISDTTFAIEQNLSADQPYAHFSTGTRSIESAVIPLKSFNIDSHLSGFSMDGYVNNKEFLQELQGLENIDNMNDREFLLNIAKVMRDSFPPDSKLSITGNADTVNGKVDADIKAWFVGNGSADGYTGMATTGDLAKAFSATVNINADKAAIMATPLAEMIQNPFALLYLTITDESVSLNATLDQLELIVNNQTIPLELMAGEMLQLPLEALLDM